MGVTEGGWDRLQDRARTLGDRDGNDKPLAEGEDDDDNEYGKNSNITNKDDEYAIGVDGVDEPLDKGDDECNILSAAPARDCPESQRPSMPSP